LVIFLLKLCLKLIASEEGEEKIEKNERFGNKKKLKLIASEEGEEKYRKISVLCIKNNMSAATAGSASEVGRGFCFVQHLGRYLEGQGHSMTLQQKRVRPITWFFEVGFPNYFTEIISILKQHVAPTFVLLP